MPACSIGCKGYCCRRFFLPFGPERLAEIAADKEHATHSFNNMEIAKVADMVIYLGADKLDCNLEPNKSGKLQHWYTCKHLNKRTGGCMNYILRPQMCSDYPYDKKCEYHMCVTQPWWRKHAWLRKLHRKLFGWVTHEEREAIEMKKQWAKTTKVLKKYKWPKDVALNESIGTEKQMDAELVQLKYKEGAACAITSETSSR